LLVTDSVGVVMVVVGKTVLKKEIRPGTVVGAVIALSEKYEIVYWVGVTEVFILVR
jgi:hypothetical protein